MIVVMLRGRALAPPQVMGIVLSGCDQLCFGCTAEACFDSEQRTGP